MIGIGGLGHMAVQILRAISAAQVIAVDIDERKLALAREVGADQAESVARLLEGSHRFADIRVLKDLGGTDRVVVARRLAN